MLGLTSCVSQNKEVYLLINEDDDLIVKDDRYYYVFSNRKSLIEFEKAKNYKPNDILKSEHEIEMNRAPFCPELKFSSTGSEREINLEEFNSLNVLDREKFLKETNKKNKIFFIEKLPDHSFLAKQVRIIICE